MTRTMLEELTLCTLRLENLRTKFAILSVTGGDIDELLEELVQVKAKIDLL